MKKEKLAAIALIALLMFLSLGITVCAEIRL